MRNSDVSAGAEPERIAVITATDPISSTVNPFDATAAKPTGTWVGKSWELIDRLELIENETGPDWILMAGRGSGILGFQRYNLQAWQPFFDRTAWQSMPFEDSTIRAIALLGGNPVVGGDFQTLGGQPIASLARWVAGGWVPLGSGRFLGTVHALATVDQGGKTKLIVGGDFTLVVGGTVIKNSALYDEATGTWAAFGEPSGPVYTILRGASSVIVGGAFDAIGGTQNDRLARYNLLAGTWEGVAPMPAGAVRAVEIDSNTGDLYVGTDTVPYFYHQRSGSSSRESSVAGGPNGPVYAIKVLSGTVYVGGDFEASGARGLTVYVPSTQTPLWLNPYVNGFVFSPDAVIRCISSNSNGDILIGGNFTLTGVSRNIAEAARGVARITGGWYYPILPLQGGVYSLEASSGNLWIGGDFSSLIPGQQVAKFTRTLSPGFQVITPQTVAPTVVPAVATGSSDTPTATPTPVADSFNLMRGISGKIIATETFNGALWVGGAFSSVYGRESQRYLSSWNGREWSVQDLKIPGPVTALRRIQDTLLIFGEKLDGSGYWFGKLGQSGYVSGIDPPGIVHAIDVDSLNRPIIGGEKPDGSGFIARFSDANGSWEVPNISLLSKPVRTLLMSSNGKLYIGGDFPGYLRTYVPASFDISYPITLPVGVLNGPVLILHQDKTSPDTILVGGSFTAVVSSPMDNTGGLASIDAKTDTITPYVVPVLGVVTAITEGFGPRYQGNSSLFVARKTLSGVAKVEGLEGTTNRVWSDVCGTIEGDITTLIGSSFTGGVGSGLYLGGAFRGIGGIPSGNLAACSGGLGRAEDYRSVSVVAEKDRLWLAKADKGNLWGAVLQSDGTPIVAGSLGIPGSIPVLTLTADPASPVRLSFLGSSSNASRIGALASTAQGFETRVVPLYSISSGIVRLFGAPYQARGPRIPLLWQVQEQGSTTLKVGSSVLSVTARVAVVDFRGNPVNGVTLVAMVKGKTIQSVRTGIDGRASFELSTSGEQVAIVPSLPQGGSFTPASAALVASVDFDSQIPLQFVWTPTKRTVRGRVMGAAGGLPGIAIDGGILGVRVTDSSGAFSFADVPEGSAIRVQPVQSGYTFVPVQFSATTNAGDDTVVPEFAASRKTFAVSGTVKKGRSNSGIKGITIDGGSIGSQTTDKDGRFSFPKVPAGIAITLEPHAPGYAFNPTLFSAEVSGPLSVTFTVPDQIIFGEGTHRSSISSAGREGDRTSGESLASALEGKMQLFTSVASNLVDGDTNGVSDVFARDDGTGITTAISVNGNGDSGNGASGGASIHASGISANRDGTRIAFVSSATNLADFEVDENGVADILVKDSKLGVVTIESRSGGNVLGNGPSSEPVLSRDGLVLGFTSDANNLVTNDQNRASDIFLKSLVEGTTLRVSESASHQEANGPSYGSSLSSDGSVISFISEATNLIEGDTNGVADVFVVDVRNGTVRRIAPPGMEPNGASQFAAISPDGKWVAFASEATNLVPDDTNAVRDVFLFELATETVSRISVGPGGIVGDGASGLSPLSIADGPSGVRVSYTSIALSLDPGGSGGRPFGAVFDRKRESSVVVSQAPGIARADGSVAGLVLSEGGGSVVFAATSTNLVSEDKNQVADVFWAPVGQFPALFIPGKRLEAPPTVWGKGRDVVCVFQRFLVRRKGAALWLEPFLGVRLPAKSPGETLEYVATVTQRGSKKAQDARIVKAKKNVLTLRNVKPGSYSVTYRVTLRKNKKVVYQTPQSPPRTFVIRPQ